MAYVVSARKYRPQRFEDVVGQDHVTVTIKNALLNDKLAHAFLFCGPRGVGKTTCARLLAKVINMPDPKSAIMDGSYADSNIDISLNIIELDAASNNSVENIRTLIDQVRFQPQQGSYKVFIIDEVHMLSQAAFNAFLKTLEEPPPYAIFILATTERHKILPTILSRCQLYDFRRIQIPDIIAQLESIATEESIKTEHDALYIIAEKADGAMRDALSIFDRISSAGDQSITVQDVIENLNILDFDYFFNATDLIMREDSSGLLLLFDKVLKNGFEGDLFMNGLAAHFRNLLYCKQNPTQSLLQMSTDLKEKYINQAKNLSYNTIVSALDIANKSDLDYPKAKDKRLHVEINLLKLCFAQRKTIIRPVQEETAPPTQKKTDKLSIQASDDVKKESARTPEKHIPAVEDKPEAREIGQDQEKEEATESDNQIKTTESSTIDQTEKTPPPLTSLDAILKKAEQEVGTQPLVVKNLSLADVDTLWDNYTDQITSPTTKSILSTVLKKVEEDKLIITVPSSIGREELQQEINLYNEIRTYFNRPDLVIEVVVDRGSFPNLDEDPSLKLVTPKEKYEHLKSLNPKVDKLIDTLGLKLDE